MTRATHSDDAHHAYETRDAGEHNRRTGRHPRSRQEQTRRRKCRSGERTRRSERQQREAGEKMDRQTYVNLPVKDVERARTFFSDLGFEFETRFSTENAACMILGGTTFAMLLAKPFFQTFTQKPICDAAKSTEVLICLSCGSRDEVDALVERAVAAGGRVSREKEDRGFMYGHAFEDLDGHIWELLFMDPQGSA
jgi:uncharacterized protein